MIRRKTGSEPPSGPVDVTRFLQDYFGAAGESSETNSAGSDASVGQARPEQGRQQMPDDEVAPQTQAEEEAAELPIDEAWSRPPPRPPWEPGQSRLAHSPPFLLAVAVAFVAAVARLAYRQRFS